MKKSENLASIISFLLGGGRLVLIRHGNTGKAESDEERQLTEKGEAQAAATRNYLSRNHNILAVFSSSAKRAIGTVTDARWSAPTRLRELYLSPSGTVEAEVLDEAFGRLQYAPLALYLQETPVAEALDSWTQRACMALDAGLREVKPGNGTILVAGHAVMSNAMASGIALELESMITEADLPVAFCVSLGEAEALELSVVERKLQIRHLDAKLLGHPAVTT